MSNDKMNPAALPDSTALALDRTRMAYERTMMAWVRTAVSLISFGFTIYKFFQYLQQDQKVVHTGLFGPRHFAMVMIGSGIIALVVATWDHRRNMGRLRAHYGPMPWSPATVLATLIGLLGVMGLLAVVFRQ
ncbi:YidH family protein [Lysobacter cavernae]|uniref:YidH family protein n=1 Tax=Lysobacter cavernae TaxID=1685901 RepID=A0ABV7RNN3_9GAMM